MRLHLTAAQTRLRAIETQLSLGHTLCSVADTAILYQRYSEARKALDRLRHAAETIRRHLDEPGHLPRESIAEMREKLKQLEARAEQVTSRFPAP